MNVWANVLLHRHNGGTAELTIAECLGDPPWVERIETDEPERADEDNDGARKERKLRYVIPDSTAECCTLVEQAMETLRLPNKSAQDVFLTLWPRRGPYAHAYLTKGTRAARRWLARQLHPITEDAIFYGPYFWPPCEIERMIASRLSSLESQVLVEINRELIAWSRKRPGRGRGWARKGLSRHSGS